MALQTIVMTTDGDGGVTDGAKVTFQYNDATQKITQLIVTVAGLNAQTALPRTFTSTPATQVQDSIFIKIIPRTGWQFAHLYRCRASRRCKHVHANNVEGCSNHRSSQLNIYMASILQLKKLVAILCIVLACTRRMLRCDYGGSMCNRRNGE
jgi:hypothetical protein